MLRVGQVAFGCDNFGGGNVLHLVVYSLRHIRQIARGVCKAAERASTAGNEGYAGILAGQHLFDGLFQRLSCCDVRNCLAVVVDGACLSIDISQVLDSVAFEEAHLGEVLLRIAAFVYVVEDRQGLVERTLEQAGCGRFRIVANFLRNARYVHHLHACLAARDGEHRGVGEGEGLVIGEGQQVARLVVEQEARAARSARQDSLAVFHGHLVSAHHSAGCGVLVVGVGTEVAIIGSVPLRAGRCAVVIQIGLARSGIVDEEHLQVFVIFLRLHILDGLIDVFLRLGVFRVGVVTHEAFVHHREEAVGAEELREVLARGFAGLLVEMEQGFFALLVVADLHRVAAEQLEEAGQEVLVLAREVVVEPELIVKVRLCPDVVREEVVVLSFIGV